MSWCFPDENAPYAQKVLDLVRDSEVFVPSVWPLEVANALVVAERGKRLKTAEATRFLSLIQGLDIHVDLQTAHEAFGGTVALARRYMISAYDAAYLELAIREALTLATLDVALRKIAGKLGVKIL
jgi:predicted nucleic acid-binding protein